MKKAENYIFSYYQQMKDGRETVGKWILAVYEIIVKGLENKTYIFDPKKAAHAVEWIEEHCRHVEGPLAPGPFLLELWQKAMISCVYGVLDPANGCRQFREVLLVEARKNGKSILASASLHQLLPSMNFEKMAAMAAGCTMSRQSWTRLISSMPTLGP